MEANANLTQPDLIRQLGEAIFHNQLLANWEFYALIGGVTLLFHIACFLGIAYLKKRGETLATKADLKEILRQLKLTTEATEEVKSSISQTDWVTREWRTTRRLKLEELLTSAYSAEEWSSKSIDKWFEGKGGPKFSEIPIKQTMLLAALYYPELLPEVYALRMVYLKIHGITVEKGKAAREANLANDMAARALAYEEFSQEYMPLYRTAGGALETLEKKAGQIMATFANN